MKKSSIFLTLFMWICFVSVLSGQNRRDHHHESGKECLQCKATEVNKEAAEKEAVYLQSHKPKMLRTRMKQAIPPEDFEYVIPVVFHVFGTEFNNGTKVTIDLIRDALIETNKDFWGLQDDWQRLHPARDSVKKPLKLTFRLAEKDPDGNPTTGITFHDWNTGFGNGSGYDSEIQKYAWDNYSYVNVYIMQDLYDDGMTNNSGVSWYPLTWMSDANLARVVYNGSYLGTNADTEFRSVLTHEFGHFFNLKHTFEGCDDQITYPNDEVDDTPAHIYDLTLAEGAKNPFGEVIDVCNFMNYPRLYKNYTKGQVARMKEALMHPARVSLWQEETHKKVFFIDPAPRLEVVKNDIYEGGENDGAFAETYRISVLDSKLKVAVGEYLPAADFTTEGLPEGLTLKLRVSEGNILEGELVGKAVLHEIKNNGSFSVTLKNSVLTEGKLLNPSLKLFYKFRAPYAIVYVDGEDINISSASNWKYFYMGAGTAEYGAWYSNTADIKDSYKLQSYKKPLVIYPGTLNIKPLALGTEIGISSDWGTPADDYKGVFNFKSPEYDEWVGQNAYVGIEFEIDGEVVYGWMNVTFSPAGDSYTIHDWAYNTKPGASIRAGETDKGIVEKVQISPARITEAVSNDGWVTDKISIRVLGVRSEFVKTGVLVAGTDYTVSGIPEGLTMKVAISNKTAGVIEFSGKALRHAKADSAFVKFELNKNLLNDSELKGLAAEIRIDFKDPYGIFYKDMEDIWISPSGSWSEFSFGIGNANYEGWYAAQYENRFKFTSAYNPVVTYKGTRNIIPLQFGEVIGGTLPEKADWVQQLTVGTNDEKNRSILDLKSDSYLEWVGQTAYVGVQFQNNGNTHYGWIGIRFEADGNMFTFEEWAYNEAPGEPIRAGYKKSNQTPYLSWPVSAVLYESVANEGQLDSLFVKVKGSKFALSAGEKLIEGTHYTTTALPAGLMVSVEVTDDLTAKIRFLGKAQNHAVSDSLKDWKFTFKDAAFTTLPMSELEHKFNIFFRDPYRVIYVDMDDITCSPKSTFTVFSVVEGKEVKFGAWYHEECLRLETYQKDLICTNISASTAYVKPLIKGYLIGKEDDWNAGGDFPNEHWIWSSDFREWTGKEAYLGFAFRLEEDYQFGWMRIAVAADGTSYQIKDYAYYTGPGFPLRAGDKGIVEPPFFVVNNKTFHEGIDNDGLIKDTIRIELASGEFAKKSGMLVENTDYTIEGLSEGLTLKAELKAADLLLVSLSGKALKNDRTASVQDLRLTFKDAAFSATTEMKKKDVRLSIDYLDPYQVVYVDFIDIECSRYNTWTLLDIDGNSYGIWYDIDGGLSLRLETYGAPLVCEGVTRNITPLKAGEIIGSGSNWVDGAEWPDEHFIHNASYTDWRGREAYIGIKYDFEGRTRYGWIRIEVSEDGQSYFVRDLAYNEMFGEPIMAGLKEGQNLMVSFTADKTATYETFEIQFTNHTFSKEPVKSYLWTFEGGTPTVFEGKNPGKVVYNHPGQYSVTLQVETADTTISFVRKNYLNIEPVMLRADFKPSTVNLIKGRKAEFTDASAGSFDIVKWEWNFEGGSPASFEGQNPVEVAYQHAGTYEVTLKVTDEKGRQHTRFASPGVIVFAENYRDYCPVVVECPTENTYCYITNVSLGERSNKTVFDGYTDYSESVQFSLLKGEDTPLRIDLNGTQEARVVAWIDWNGDGVFDASEKIVSYIEGFDKPEKLMVRIPENAVDGITGMRVRTKIGDRELTPCEDEGYYGEVEDYSVVIGTKLLTGQILADKQNIRSGEYVNFKANINEITENEVESYRWIFAGAVNTVSAQRVPSAVQYMEVGAHDVTLELTLQGGEKKVVEKKSFIVVNQAVTLASFEASVTDILEGGQVGFTDHSESFAGIVSWNWSFEGGVPATCNGQTPPAVVYNHAGLYEVVLKVTDVSGQSNTLIKPMLIDVHEKDDSYCGITGTGSYYSIVKVALGDKQNLTTDPPVSYNNDFTDFIFDLGKGESYDFTIELSGNMAESQAWVMAWVDWNQDGVFNEATETVARYQDNARPADLKLKVPADAKEGVTRMRVRTDYYNFLEPCAGMGGMGELEDYTILVKKERLSGYIIADNTNPAIGEPVLFTAFVNQITDQSVQAYKWIFEGGTPGVSTDRKPSAVTYATEGVYSVTLELTLESGVKKNITMYDYITAGTKVPEVSVGFSASSSQIVVGENVNFNVVSTGIVTGYSWTFEGGSPAVSTVENPVVTYSADGIYDVTLVAQLQDGTTRTVKKSNYIRVNPFLLIAGFTVPSRKVNSGAEVSFTNTSIGAESYSWDFGDGSPVTEDEHPTHIFASAGTYQVKLKVMAGTDEHTKQMTIAVSELKAADCVPAGSLSSAYGLKSVRFGELVNDKERNAYYNDFTSESPFVMAPGTDVAYDIQFKNSWGPLGVYAWIDWNNDGSFDSTERVIWYKLEAVPADKTIHVPEGLPDGLIRMRIATDYYGTGTLNPCSGAMTVEDYTVRMGAIEGEEQIKAIRADKAVVLENEPVTLSVDGVKNGVTYSWTFAGAVNESSVEAAPAVRYATPGAYDVKVTLTSGNGTSEILTESRFIVVKLAEIAADFTADKSLCALGEEVRFSSVSSASFAIQSVKWTFEGGNPAVSESANPVVTYAVPGKYAVTLQITDEFGKTDTKQMPEMIEVKEFLKADFTASKTVVAAGDPVTFINRSSAATSYSWTFDNGEPATSTEVNPVVRFNETGATMVTLVAKDAMGQHAVKSEILTVTPKTFGAIQLGQLVQVYDGTAKKVNVATVPASLAKDVKVVYKQNGQEVIPQDAGVYEVTATYSGIIPYHVEEVSAQLEIKKVILEIVASKFRQTYTGSPLRADIATIPAGFENLVLTEYLQNGIVTEPARCGTYLLRATINGKNYDARPLEEEFVIRKMTGQVVIMLEKEYVYDGTPKFIRSVTTIPAGLATEVTYNGQTEGATAIGVYKVAADILDTNYEGRGEVLMEIMGSVPEVQIVQSEFVYDGTHHDLKFVMMPACEDPRISYEQDGHEVDSVIYSGNYKYSIRVEDGNYKGVVQGRMAVKRAPAVINISGLRVGYDGDPKGVTVTTKPADLPVEVTYNGFSQLPYVPGEYVVFVEVTDTSYQGYKTVKMQIVPDAAEMKVMDLVVSDGTHDCIFRVPELEGRDKSLVMYNKLGAIVFEAKEYYDDFDMRDLPSGTYFYVLKYMEGGEAKVIKSFVEVIRK